MTDAAKAAEECDRIERALADPGAPWYGSDLVEWVADQCQHVRALLAEIERHKAKTCCIACHMEGERQMRERATRLVEHAHNMAEKGSVAAISMHALVKTLRALPVEGE